MWESCDVQEVEHLWLVESFMVSTYDTGKNQALLLSPLHSPTVTLPETGQNFRDLHIAGTEPQIRPGVRENWAMLLKRVMWHKYLFIVDSIAGSRLRHKLRKMLHYQRVRLSKTGKKVGAETRNMIIIRLMEEGEANGTSTLFLDPTSNEQPANSPLSCLFQILKTSQDM